MRHLLLGIVLVGFASVASAQTKPSTTPAPGSASVKTQLRSLHYKNIRDLRRGPDGQWTGKATRGNVPKTVTIAPDGTVTAR